jgi:hypothetical protein
MWRTNMAMRDAEKAMEQARAQLEASRQARTVIVAAADILEEFQSNPDLADKKYQGKCLELTGVVERYGANGGGAPFVILRAGDKQTQIKIECFFDFDAADANPTLRHLEKGQAVTIRGEYLGRISHLQVRACTLVQ